eukprot:365141-Chlamydomonas_euryale.AAC.5
MLRAHAATARADRGSGGWSPAWCGHASSMDGRLGVHMHMACMHGNGMSPHTLPACLPMSG